MTTTESRHSSATPEHFTPSPFVEAARQTLGGIDFDPASCAAANRVVRATHYLTKEDNGFTRAWAGRVFLNPPGGFCDLSGRLVIKASTKNGVRVPGCVETGACGIPAPHQHDACNAAAKAWWFKLAREFTVGRAEAAVFVAFSIELFQSTQIGGPADLPIPLDFPICWPSRRVSYVRVDGSVGDSPPHSSGIVLVSRRAGDVERFGRHFAEFGRVFVPRRIETMTDTKPRAIGCVAGEAAE